MNFPVLWLGLGGLVVLLAGLWLRRRQAEFVAGLRARGDPLAERRGSKVFRREFQAWLVRGAGAPGARAALTLLLAAGLMGLAAWSLWPAGLWND